MWSPYYEERVRSFEVKKQKNKDLRKSNAILLVSGHLYLYDLGTVHAYAYK
jgi:hypothetical protein